MNSLDFANRVIELTNLERSKAGLAPVTLDSQLSCAALDHSTDMAVNDYFSHTGLDESSPGDRIQAAGYRYSIYGENIAAGQETPEEVVQAWMDSPGHRVNILKPEVQNIGVGYFFLSEDSGSIKYQRYWTQVFSTRSVYGTNIVGKETSETLQGGIGGDSLVGNGGDDVLIGNVGNDVFCGNEGNDTLYGNEGNDTLYGNQGVDFLTGDTGNDMLCGGKDNDSLDGNQGNDQLYGNLGNDTISGGEDDDLICGGQDADFLLGESGNDTLSGDIGIDTLTGGNGSDRFLLQVDRGTDTVVDFQQGIDILGLCDGLTFANLTLTQGIGDNAANTLITSHGDLLAVLTGIQASTITNADFQLF